MRRLCILVWIFVFCRLGFPLLAEESRGAKPSVGDLVKQLRDADPDKVCTAAQALGRREPTKDATSALAELLKSTNGRVKWTAAEALCRLAHPAADLAPVYADLLIVADADVRAASAWRLGRMGLEARRAVPLLAAALRDENLEVRVQVGQALANLGEVAEPALPALVRALGDQQLDERSGEDNSFNNVRRSPALPALVRLADKAMPLLIESFSAKQPERRDEESTNQRGEARLRAALAFAAFGPRAVPPLLRALGAKDAATREYAACALGEIAQLSGLAEGAATKLEGCLDDPEKEVRRTAAKAMSWVRPSSAKAVPILVEARTEGTLRSTDLLAHLARMAPHNEAARKQVMRLLGDDNKDVAHEAYRVLAALELPAAQSLKVWTAALAHADSRVRHEALRALTKLGPSAKAAKPALRERLTKEDDYYCKGGILDALTAIDPDDPQLVPLLLKMLDDPESWVRWQALDCIAQLGPRAKGALDRLETSLLNPKARGRVDKLADAIDRIAPGSARTAAPLLAALRDRGVRAVHCPKNTWFMRDRLEDELFARLPEAAPLLREALKDSDDEVRSSAALVLLRAGSDTSAALPVLMANLWREKDASDKQRQFESRVVELLSRRRTAATTEAVAAAWCEAWRTATHEGRETLEPGLLVLQPEALPHLLEQLRQAKSADSRRDIAFLLARFEGQGKVAVPILRKELREPKPARHYPAAQALALLGADAAEAVPELVELLESKHPAVQAVAARALASIGPAAKLAVPRLKAMLRDGAPELRLLAAGSLSRIDPYVSEPLAFLRDALVSEKEFSRFRGEIERPKGVAGEPVFPETIEEALAHFGDHVVPILAAVLDDTHLDEWSAENVSTQCGAYARVRAARLLAKIGPDAHKAVPALTRALSDRDPFVRDAAASALGRIGPAAKEAAAACITLFEEQNRLGAGSEGWTSGTQTGQSRRTTPFDFRSLGRGKVLSQNDMYGYGFFSDPLAHVRPAYPSDAAYVLSRIDARDCSALPVLMQAAKDPSHPARLSAALAIWRCGRESPELIPAFTAALEADATSAKGTRNPLPRDVRDCLAELGAELKPAIDVLAEWLKQRQELADDKDVAAVVEAIGHLGADAEPLADLLRPMLRVDRLEARRRMAAALALYRVLGDGDLALPVLREVLLGKEERTWIYTRRDPANAPRVHAVRALALFAEKGDARARSLIEAVARGDENRHVQNAAREVMARMK